MLWPCGRDECDVSIDKRKISYLFSLSVVFVTVHFLLIPFYYYFGATSN